MARYHRLLVWKLAMDVLSLVIEDLPHFRGEAEMRNQLKAAARSTVANICEGSEAGSKPEFRRFLAMARGSNTEVQAWYEIAQASRVLEQERCAYVVDRIDHCGRSLTRLLRSFGGGG